MPSKPDLQPLLDVQSNQLNLVFGDSNGIDAKALAVIGANVAALLFIDDSDLHAAIWKTLLIYAPFVVSLFLDIIAVWPRKYLVPIPEKAHVDRYLQMSARTLLLQLLSNTEASIKQNSALNEKRMRACMASVVLTGLGFVALLFIL